MQETCYFSNTHGLVSLNEGPARKGQLVSHYLERVGAVYVDDPAYGMTLHFVSASNKEIGFEP